MTRSRRRWLIGSAALGFLSLAGIFLRIFHRLPPLEGRAAGSGPIDPAATRLGRAVATQAAAHPGRSGVHALRDGRDAFAARMLMAEAAERTRRAPGWSWCRPISSPRTPAPRPSRRWRARA